MGRELDRAKCKRAKCKRDSRLLEVAAHVPLRSPQFCWKPSIVKSGTAQKELNAKSANSSTRKVLSRCCSNGAADRVRGNTRWWMWKREKHSWCLQFVLRWHSMKRKRGEPCWRWQSLSVSESSRRRVQFAVCVTAKRRVQFAVCVTAKSSGHGRNLR